MAERTPNYNLLKLAAGEALNTENYDFTSGNMDIIDRALAQSLDRPGTVGTLIVDPTLPLELTLDTTAGNIPAGSTAYYRFSYVDALGAETAAAATAQLTTPSIVNPPNAPVLSTATTGGTLAPGSYFYVLTAYAAVNTSETRGVNRSTITIPSGTNTNVVTITLPTVPVGADGFNLFRRAPSESEYSYVASIDMSIATPPSTYDDDGSVSPNCTRRPPLQNQTNNSNSIDIGIPGATPVVDASSVGWKIYRTYDNTNWNNSYLVTVVEETTEGSGIITPFYTDIGNASSSGKPLEVTSQIAGNEKILFTDMDEVQGYIPVARNIVPAHFTWLIPGTTTTTVAHGPVWTCPFAYAEIQWVDVGLGREEVAANGDVEIDVSVLTIAATPTYTTIFDQATPALPTILDGEYESGPVVPGSPSLVYGDRLVLDVSTITSDPVDDITVTVYLLVRENANGDTSETSILGL